MYASASDGYSDGLGSKPSAAAALTGLFRQVAVQSGFDVLAGSGFPSPVKIRDNTFECDAVFLFVGGRRAVHENLYELFRYLAKRFRLADFHFFAEPFDQAVIEDIHSLAAFTPGIDSAVFHRDAFIRHYEVGVKLKNRPQAVAASACPIWTVETEEAGREFFETCLGVFWAGKFFAVNNLLPLAVAAVCFTGMRFLHEHEKDTVCHFKCRLDGISQAHANRVLDYQPVNNRRDIVLFILVQNRNVAHVIDSPVNPHADKAFPLYAGENIFVLAFFAADQRGANLELGVLGP